MQILYWEFVHVDNINILNNYFDLKSPFISTFLTGKTACFSQQKTVIPMLTVALKKKDR